MIGFIKKFVLSIKNNLKYYYLFKVHNIDYDDYIINLLNDSDKRLEKCSIKIDELISDLNNENKNKQTFIEDFWTPQFINGNQCAVFISHLKKYFPDYKIKCYYVGELWEYRLLIENDTIKKGFTFSRELFLDNFTEVIQHIKEHLK